MPVIRNALIISAIVSAPVVPAMVFTPPLLSEPNPEHRALLERRNLSQLAYAGMQLFTQHCADCHGAQARGTVAGPNLHADAYHPGNLSRQDFHHAVTQGMPALRGGSGGKPGNKDLSFNQIELIARYVRELQRPKRYQ